MSPRLRVQRRSTRCSSAPDERHVTMQAYENPAFVEDIARDAASLLQSRRSHRARSPSA